jgi:valyl-tRNA synthetase
VIPFVTDELWRALTHGESVMVAAWPAPDPARADAAAEAEVAGLQKIVTEVRRFRSDQGVKPGQRVATRLSGLDTAGVADHEPLIRSLARLDPPTDDFAASATLTVSGARPNQAGAGGNVTVALDTRGAIDVAAERARLTKELTATEKELSQCRAKIRDRLATAEREHERLTAALAALPQG